jgi:hypothetical protein
MRPVRVSGTTWYASFIRVVESMATRSAVAMFATTPLPLPERASTRCLMKFDEQER